MPKGTGIYIGGSGLRGAVVSGGKRPEVTGTWKGGEGPGGLDGPSGLARAVAAAASGAIGRTLSVSIPDTMVRAAVMEFDSLPSSGKEAAAIVAARAERELGAGLASSAVAFQALPGGRKVFCVAADKALVDAIGEGGRASGVKVARISPHSVNLANLIEAGMEDLAVVARVEGSVTMLVFKGGVLDFYRCKEARGDEDFRREAASGFAFYGGRLGRPIERVILFDEAGNGGAACVPGRVEIPGPALLKVRLGPAEGDLGLMAAAGACI